MKAWIWCTAAAMLMGVSSIGRASSLPNDTGANLANLNIRILLEHTVSSAKISGGPFTSWPIDAGNDSVPAILPPDQNALLEQLRASFKAGYLDAGKRVPGGSTCPSGDSSNFVFWVIFKDGMAVSILKSEANIVKLSHVPASWMTRKFSGVDSALVANRAQQFSASQARIAGLLTGIAYNNPCVSNATLLSLAGTQASGVLIEHASSSPLAAPAAGH